MEKAENARSDFFSGILLICFLEVIYAYLKKSCSFKIHVFLKHNKNDREKKGILVKVTNFLASDHKMLNNQNEIKHFVYFEDLFSFCIFAIYELTPFTAFFLGAILKMFKEIVDDAGPTTHDGCWTA